MKLPENIQGAIFDLDGTLLDSLDVWQEVDAKFFAKRGIPMPENYLHIVKAMELFEAAIYTKTEFSLPEPPEMLVQEWRDMVKTAYAEHVCMKPFALEAIKRLHGLGIKLAIATSSARELFLPTLKRYGADSLFSAIAETGEAKRGKAFPDVYLLAAERLKLPPENCAVFEDILVGVKSANQGGFFTVAVYDPASARDRAALEKEANLYLTTLDELFLS